MIRKMINWIKRLLAYDLKKLNQEYVECVHEYRKENHSLSGRIKLLEEQQEIMHNFLVEINNYLVKYTENHSSKE